MQVEYDAGATLEVIGKHWGVSRERVRQIIDTHRRETPGVGIKCHPRWWGGRARASAGPLKATSFSLMPSDVEALDRLAGRSGKRSAMVRTLIREWAAEHSEAVAA